MVLGRLSDGTIAAVKVYPPTAIEDWQRESHFLEQCKNRPNIIQMVGAYKRDERIVIYLQYHRRGSLFKQLSKSTWDPLNAPKIIRQLTEAALFLHSNGIIHRDIKPGNILLSDEGDAVLCDFGIATVKADTSVGTPEYMAPEMCQSPPNYGFPVDVWAIGCVLNDMLFGLAPTNERCYGPPRQHECSVDLYEVLTKIFVHDPAQRITCESLLKLRYYQQSSVNSTQNAYIADNTLANCDDFALLPGVCFRRFRGV